MLSDEDLRREAERFGVAEEQVRRDHAISHVLAAISERASEDVVFFGGTALSRTHLAEGRLSEDIDLIARGPRSDVVDKVRRSVSQGLLRSHGRVTWNPDFSTRDTEAAVLTTPDGISVRVQVLGALGYPNWPTEFIDIEQRYVDAPPAHFHVPTIDSFAAWKTTAWFDRGVARDLYDLWALARRGYIRPEAAHLFVQHGPTNNPPRSFMFAHAPAENEWTAQLANQTRLIVTAIEALDVVRNAWAAAVGDDWT